MFSVCCGTTSFISEFKGPPLVTFLKLTAPPCTLPKLVMIPLTALYDNSIRPVITTPITELNLLAHSQQL